MAERRFADLEVGVSGSGRSHGLPLSPLGRRRVSYRALGSSTTLLATGGGGGGVRFFCELRPEEEARHFLDSCSLCKKPLGGHRDIFMYRGDTPFCSEECRQEQIDTDEAREKSWSNVLAIKASSRKEQQQEASAAARGIRLRAAGTVVAG